MRQIITLAIAWLPLVTFSGEPHTVVLDVQNMSCAVCPITVSKALEQVPGVTDAKIDFDRKTATVTYDPDRTGPAALTKATTDARYPSTLHP
ncbi:mercury resistance system periplasmic binding protein MerP [Methylocaldum gracile]|jgi:mercuric ion binding protein|nr:mercury resistance system periplasmic binding protein MerP [Methylocaldum sp. BRCS4]